MPADIADCVCAGLKKVAQQEDLEQVVCGFDHRDELGLHPLIHQSLRAEGYGVWPETRYPSDWVHRKRNIGKRCDIVLTPDGLPLRDPQAKDTLFDNQPALDPQQAYWLEIKSVAQFERDGPFRRYSTELLSSVTNDVKKLWRDGLVRYGGLLILLFTQDQTVAEHDLLIWHERCLNKGYPVGPPALRGFPMTDRIGNGWCSIAMFGVRGV